MCGSPRLAGLGLRAICGLLFFAVGFLADLTAFPQGSLWRERPPPRRVLIVRHCVRRLTSSRAAPADKKGGLPPPAPLSCGALARRARGGHARHSLATFVAADAGNPFQPASNTAFQVKSPPQRRGLPSEREALWLSKACATYVRHQVFFSGALIRRHRRDPRRRKLSTHPAPAGAASWLLSTAVP